jgi:sodium transport system permease protein
LAARDVWAIYRVELRSALRERNIVVYSILLPLLLYPVLLWVMLTGFSFVQGQTEGIVSRVALVDLPREHDALRQRIAGDPQIRISSDGTDIDAAMSDLRASRVDAVIRFAADEKPGFENLAADVAFDGARDRSASARGRIETILDDYRATELSGAAGRLGVNPIEWQQYHIALVDQTSARETGVYVLRVLLPALLIVMIALGCFYPAIDATAGERERSTWETTMTLAAPRSSIVTAKFLYVATLGTGAALLNIAAMVMSLGPIVESLTGGRGKGATFSIPLTAIPVIVAGAVLLALFVAAAMMIFAAFARTFKEGQTMVSPFYFLTLLPVMFLQSPDLVFTPALALVPVVNVAMMFRDAIGGLYQWPLIGLTVVVEAATIGVCLAFARWVLRFEEVWMGSFQGTLFAFVRRRLGGPSTPTEGGKR